MINGRKRNNNPKNRTAQVTSMGYFTDSRSILTRTTTIYIFIFVLALLIRFTYLIEIKDEPIFTLLLGDAERYDAWAKEISEGNWLGDEIFYQAPLYPYFLGIIYTIFGRNLLVVRLVQILIGSISCVLIARSGEYFFSKKAGFISGFILALYPTAIFFDCLIQKAVLGMFFTILLLFLVGKNMHRPTWARWILIGVVLGCLGLTRESAMVFVFVIFIWLLVYFRKESNKKIVLWVTTFIVGLLWNQGKFDDAIYYYKKVLKARPDYNPATYYNIACFYALQNNVEESIIWLKKAIKNGYKNWKLIKTDKDLANIRSSSYYLYSPKFF